MRIPRRSKTSDSSAGWCWNPRRARGECLLVSGLTLLGITIVNTLSIETLIKRARTLNPLDGPGDLRRLLDIGDEDSPAFVGALKALDSLSHRNVSSLILHVGAVNSPIMPRKEDGPCARSLAFEPIVVQSTPLIHPQVAVVPAAVRGGHGAGMTTMTVYNKGLSSSLSKASYLASWNRHEGDGFEKKVPVLSMKSIIETINYPIDMIVTDMQGSDFEAISSVGQMLVDKGVKRLVTEVMFDDQTAFEGQQNDFCRDWVPYMKKIGYVYEGSMPLRKFRVFDSSKNLSYEDRCKQLNTANGPTRQFKPNNIKEFGACWRLASADPDLAVGSHEAILAYQRPNYVVNNQLNPDYHQFSPDEYAHCELQKSV